jgi:hypothetical protein
MAMGVCDLYPLENFKQKFIGINHFILSLRKEYHTSAIVTEYYSSSLSTAAIK